MQIDHPTGTAPQVADSVDEPMVSAPEEGRDVDTPPSYLMEGRSAAAGADHRGESSADHGAPTPAVLALVEAANDQETPEDLPLVLESLLFSAEEPPTVSALAQATNAPRDAVEQALDVLQAEGAGRGIRIQRNGSTVRLVSAPQAAAFIERLLGLERPNRLSKAALETVAIIAYRQPVTRGAIEAVRGVSCDAPLSTLRSRELIQSVGQADTPGRPNLWATTPRFLEHFGLSGLTELPTLPEIPGRPAAQASMGLISSVGSTAQQGGEAPQTETAEIAPNDYAALEHDGPAVASGD